MRVLVCGSRTFAQSGIIESVLDGLRMHATDDMTVIEGGASGADKAACIWALARAKFCVTHEQYRADWDKNGKAAGPIRNQKMLDKGKPNMVLAFVDKPLEESRGTYDMVKRARRAGVPVNLIWRM